MFKRLAGTPDIAPVPYRGMGPAQADVISGKVSIFFPNVTGTIGELQRTRKLKVLAVNAATRHDTLPEIPTAEEAGLPGMISQSFFGIFAPAQAPARVLERVH